MSSLHSLAVLISAAISAGPDQMLPPEAEGMLPPETVTIELPDAPPFAFPASDQLLERDVLRGTWQVVYVEQQGFERPDLAADLQMKFTRGRLDLIQRGRRTIVVGYQLRFDQVPGHFTWIMRPGGVIMQQKGVYWTDGNRLLLCVAPINKRRANDFLTQPDDGRTLYAMERMDPQNVHPAAAPWVDVVPNLCPE